jgi:hypothetical protein
VPTRRCSTCGINYPAGPFGGVPKCQVDSSHELAYVLNTEPDKDWKKRVDMLKARLAEAGRELEAVPQAKETLNIYEEDGLFWVNAFELFRSGVEFNSSDANFRLFQANGHIWETQGWDERRRRWWIEQVAVAVFLPEPA